MTRATAEARRSMDGDPVCMAAQSVEWMLPAWGFAKRARVFSAASWFVGAPDWFTYHLTGEWTFAVSADRLVALRTLGVWPLPLLARLG
jgi:hypothetical protein